MLNNFISQLSHFSDLINAASLLISLVTLITIFQFKRRIRIEFEKKEFQSKQKRIIKDLEGFSDSLIDDMYDEKFLGKIELYLHDLLVQYTFWNRMLVLKIRFTCFRINSCIIKEIKRGNNSSRHKLCQSIHEIAILMRKE